MDAWTDGKKGWWSRTSKSSRSRLGMERKLRSRAWAHLLWRTKGKPRRWFRALAENTWPAKPPFPRHRTNRPKSPRGSCKQVGPEGRSRIEGKRGCTPERIALQSEPGSLQNICSGPLVHWSTHAQERQTMLPCLQGSLWLQTGRQEDGTCERASSSLAPVGQWDAVSTRGEW